MLETDTKDEPMWDQPEVHEVYRDWRRVLDEYDGDRMAVAEAWTQTPERTAAYVRPDELQQAFNFAWLLAKWDAADMADCIRRTFATLDPVGANPTWVLSNHDVVRHATRYGGGPVGVARARAATLAMLALPGSAYLYQGEELGLESVDVPEELRQDPAWFRTGVEWRDHCRVPMPWSGTKAPFGFGGRRQPWLPMPAEWAGPHGRGADRQARVDAGAVPQGAEGTAYVRHHGPARGRDPRPRQVRAGLPPRPDHGRAERRQPPGRRCRRARCSSTAAGSSTASCRRTPRSGCADRARSRQASSARL